MGVYLIQGADGGLVKIGKANNAERRLKKIQRFSPVRLRLLAVAEGGRRLETQLHRKYREHRMWGEWFDFPLETLVWLQEWMDQRSDWQWALSTRVTEMKQLVDEKRATFCADNSLPRPLQEWLSERLRDLRHSVTDLRSVMQHYLLPTLAKIEECASNLLSEAGTDGSFPRGTGELFRESVDLLRDLAVSLREIIKRQAPAPVLAPPVPPPLRAIRFGSERGE